MSENLIIGAVVENGIIVNTLVFEDGETMRDFNCLPLSPGQGIGDVYISPEDYKKQETERTLRALLDEI